MTECARIFAVCMRLIEQLREAGVLVKGSAFKSSAKRQRRENGRTEVSIEDITRESDTLDVQLHTNTRAASQCQGVYLNPFINMWGVIAPGEAHLGYFDKPREAAIAYSRFVTETARALGRDYEKRPWPRSHVDRRHF